jgi:hypothetical protein
VGLHKSLHWLGAPGESRRHLCAVVCRRPISISFTHIRRFLDLPACGSAVFSDAAFHGDHLYQNGCPASPAKPSRRFGGVQSHSATCLPRRIAGSGILNAGPIVFGLQMRTAGSTRMVPGCRMLRQRPKRFIAVGKQDRMRHHCHVQHRQQLSEHVEPIVPISRETLIALQQTLATETMHLLPNSAVCP